MNKRGEQVISVYWFVMITLVAGGIVAMVLNFYGFPSDVREVESQILLENVADCISYTGVLNSNLFNNGTLDSNFSLIDECGLNFNTEDDYNWDEDLQYFVRVNFYSVNNLDSPYFSLSDGNSKLEAECEIKNSNFKKLVYCNEGRFYSLDESNNQYLIEINSVVRKTEKNVKQ